jgi:glycerol kinase
MRNQQYLCSIDQGTTGTTALIVDISHPAMPTIIGKKTVDFPQHYPKSGWVDHDLNDIWKSVEGAINGACQVASGHRANFRRDEIVGLGITNQRETICFFDRATGEPVQRAIVWQCKRSSDICDRLKKGGFEKTARAKTGLVLDPYFSGTKIAWVMENNPDVAKKVREEKAWVGTIDAWLVHKLTNGEHFATEPSNASRTLLFNIESGKWDSELITAMGLPNDKCLPMVCDSAGSFGKTSGLSFLPDGIPIAGILGDQQAALAGQACFDIGLGKCTFGTGAFLLVNQGQKPIASKSGLLTTVAWSLNGKLTYAFEGSAFIAGAAVQFLRDQIGIVSAAADSEAIARPATAAPEVYFVPALAGLGAPTWDHKARGAFLGLTRGTSNAQLVRATLEGIALEVCDLITAIESDLGRSITTLKVDGGASANGLLMQMQADFANLAVERPVNLETTAFGAAMFAGLGIGAYKDLHAVTHARQVDCTFQPQNTADYRTTRKDILAGWQRAKAAVQVFAGTSPLR